jgi:hypothetical protein
MSQPPSTTPPLQQIPQHPTVHNPGSLVGYFTSVAGQTDNLVQRLGITPTAILLLVMLALLSVYFMRDSVSAVITIYGIAVVAVMLARWMKL